MRFLLALTLAAVVVVSFFAGCSSPTACEASATLLCQRAVACSAPGHTTFIDGNPPGLWHNTEYTTESSCDDLLSAMCPQGDLTAQEQASYAACQSTAASSECGQIVDPGNMKNIQGARMSAECFPLFMRQ